MSGKTDRINCSIKHLGNGLVQITTSDGRIVTASLPGGNGR